MDNDLRNCLSHSSRPICTPSDAPRCHHVPTNTFFCSFSTQKYCPAFIYSNFPSDPSSFPSFFLTFPALLISLIITQFYHAKERKWNGLAQNPLTVWKTTPLWSFGSRMCRISELRARSSAPLLPEYSVIKRQTRPDDCWFPSSRPQKLLTSFHKNQKSYISLCFGRTLSSPGCMRNRSHSLMSHEAAGSRVMRLWLRFKNLKSKNRVHLNHASFLTISYLQSCLHITAGLILLWTATIWQVTQLMLLQFLLWLLWNGFQQDEQFFKHGYFGSNASLFWMTVVFFLLVIHKVKINHLSPAVN